MFVFGPVPSRRLGNSLGINHIPAKNCTYACVYCQVGKTTSLTIKRMNYYSVEKILEEVQQKIAGSRQIGVNIDYLTLVPDGEPTLDLRLGTLIRSLKEFQIPVAVISNASLIDRPDVRDDLSSADWVSLKLDSVIEREWKKINRPHGRLVLVDILDGIKIFRQMFTGELVTESMLVAGINDAEISIRELRDYLLDLGPTRACLSIPIRPPAEDWVKPPAPDQLGKVLKIFSEKVDFLQLLFEAEASDFRSTSNFVEDLLSIIAVHPIREEALRIMTDQAGESWDTVNRLIASSQIQAIRYRDDIFYLSRHES